MEHAQALTLLIVDDEASIRKGLAHAINWADKNITVVGQAKNGAEAYEAICALHPDIVITDIKMPECTGLELIEKVRAQGLTTSFIILSGYEDFSFAQRAMRSQVCTYLLKPVKTAELLREVERISRDIFAQRTKGAQRERERFAAQRGTHVMQEQFYTRLAAREYHSETQALQACEAAGARPLCPCVAAVFRFTLPEVAEPAYFCSEDGRLFKTALRNVVEELAQDAPPVFFRDTGNDLGALFAATGDVPAFLQRCIDTMKSISALELTAGLGPKAETLMETAASCRTALEMVEYHLYESEIQVFDCTQMQAVSAASPAQPPTMQRLAEAVVADDEAVIHQELETFFKTVFYIPMPPPRYVRGMCAYMMSDVTKRVVALLQHDSPLSFSPWPQEMENISTFRSLRAYLCAALLNTAKEIQHCKKAHLPLAVEEAQKYIQEHVLSRLRVEHVAAYVHLSESHFAALFKKSVGITARDYMLRCRLEKAKELLLGKRLTIVEIAEALEYEDYRSFSRAFKRFYGCSPTEFQSSITKPRSEGETW